MSTFVNTDTGQVLGLVARDRPPASRIGVDHWHLVRLANLMVTKVRLHRR